MFSLLLNDSGDLEFDNVMNLKTVEGTEEVIQRLKLGLATNQGEWFLNTALGIPWRDILGNKLDVQGIKRQIVRVLKEDASVKEITNIVVMPLSSSDRTVELTFEAILVDGSELRETLEV